MDVCQGDLLCEACQNNLLLLKHKFVKSYVNSLSPVSPFTNMV